MRPSKKDTQKHVIQATDILDCDTPQAVKELATQLSRDEGLKPHEWLLKIMHGHSIPQGMFQNVYNDRGELSHRVFVVEEIYPPLDVRIDAAKAIAAYYAPRLANLQVGQDNGPDNLTTMSDDQLDNEIKLLAHALGETVEAQHVNSNPRKPKARSTRANARKTAKKSGV